CSPSSLMWLPHTGALVLEVVEVLVVLELGREVLVPVPVVVVRVVVVERVVVVVVPPPGHVQSAAHTCGPLHVLPGGSQVSFGPSTTLSPQVVSAAVNLLFG